MWILWDTYTNGAAGEPVISFNMADLFFRFYTFFTIILAFQKNSSYDI